MVPHRATANYTIPIHGRATGGRAKRFSRTPSWARYARSFWRVVIFLQVLSVNLPQCIKLLRIEVRCLAIRVVALTSVQERFAIQFRFLPRRGFVLVSTGRILPRRFLRTTGRSARALILTFLLTFSLALAFLPFSFALGVASGTAATRITNVLGTRGRTPAARLRSGLRDIGFLMCLN